MQITARLWESNGRLIGFAYNNAFQNIVDAFTESCFTPAMQTAMMDWLVTAAWQRNQATGKSDTLDAWPLENNLPRIKMLEHFGFTRQEESSLLLACPYDHRLPFVDHHARQNWIWWLWRLMEPWLLFVFIKSLPMTPPRAGGKKKAGQTPWEPIRPAVRA